MLCSLLLMILLTVSDDHDLLNVSNSEQYISKFSKISHTSNNFPNNLLTVFDDHKSCSLSETMNTIFPNLVKDSHTSNNFPNDLFTVSYDIHRFCLLFQIVISILSN